MIATWGGIITIFIDLFNIEPSDPTAYLSINYDLTKTAEYIKKLKYAALTLFTST